MPSVRDTLAPSGRPLRSLAVAAVLGCTAVTSAVLPGAVASADELAGTTVVGELVQVWAEGEHADAGHTVEGPLSFVATPDGDAVRVPSADVEDLPAGATVSVTVGSEVADEAAVEHGVEPARTVLTSDLVAAPADATALPAAAGPTNQVTVAMIAPAGTTEDGTTVEELVSTVNGPVAEFWSEQSDGAITVGVTASHGWTTTTAGCADPTKLWDEAAAKVGFVAGAGRHLMLYLPETAPGCAYALAEVGRTSATGGRLYVRDTVPSVISHELGHNFGLGHSSARQCDAAVEGGNCRTSAYRDYYDVMGVSWEQLGSLNVAQAARLKVLSAASVQTLTVRDAATTVTLSPLAGREGTRALQLTDADAVDYWLEYRTPADRDAWLGSGNRYGLDSGVLLRQASRKLPDTSLLLDGTPSGAADWNTDLQTALPVGSPVPVSGGDFTVVVQSAGPAGAVVSVTPTGSATQAVVPAPTGEPVPSDVVMPATAGTTPPVVVTPPEPSVPDQRSVQLVRSSPEPTAVADATPGVGVLVALASAALAGGALAGRRLLKRASRAR